mgnify:CR=1 FL=1
MIYVPLGEMPLDSLEKRIKKSHDYRQERQTCHDAGRIEICLGIVDQIANTSAGSNIFTQNGSDNGETHADAKAGERPRHGSGKINMADHLPPGCP